jgi:hypothetical protein
VLRGRPLGSHGSITVPAAMPGDVPGHHAGTSVDPSRDHLHFQVPDDPAGYLLTIGLGQHPALGHAAPPRRSHFAEDLHQDQLLRPVGIKAELLERGGGSVVVLTA